MSAVMEADGKLWTLEWVQQGVGIIATRAEPRADNSDSAIAFAEVLERTARRIRAGASAEDEARQLAAVVRIAERRT